ncbi:hypothetical protein BGW80DRAFT_15638 [Lactifluus volemus]|nr:hypothetical protein BGW80DRAFT_15638 [Lactifluus volemus]
MREILSQNVKTSVLKEAFEDNIEIQTGDPLHSRLTIDSHRWKEVTSLHRENPFSTQQSSGTEYPLSSPFPNWPPSPPLLAPCPQTPPLFSRTTITSGQPSRVPRAMADLPLMTPLASSDDDKGMLEYPTAIDGWSVSETSPPATPSLEDRASKIYDIFVPPSDSPRPIHDLLAAEMDPVYMPRQSGTGGSRGDLRGPGQGKLFREYIGTIVDMARCPKTSTAAVAPGDLAHDDHAILIRNDVWQCSDDTGEAFLDHLTPDFPYGTVDTVLVDKSADLGDESMQVPPMPPPNVHTHRVVWPSDMSSLVTHSAFLTIKGVKSLNFELTWRPYDSEQVIPTLEELVGVSEHHYFPATICGDLDGSRAQLTELLNQLDPLTQLSLSRKRTKECSERFRELRQS